jgi:hypothetical protein
MDVADSLDNRPMTERRIVHCKRMTMKRPATVTLVALSIGMLMSAVAVLTQERSQEEVKPVAEARQLLLAAYPELREGRVDWRLKTTPDGPVIEARRVEGAFDRDLGRRLALVSGAVTIDENGDLQSLVAGGSLLDAVRRRAEKIAAMQPGDVSGALKADGARHSPDDAASAATLVPPGVKAVLATPIAHEALFEAGASPSRQEEKLTWQVDVESTGPAAKRFTIVIEPIEGRLVSIIRR